MRNWVVWGAALVLSGCVQKVATVNQFDPSEVEWSKASGDNTITGQAFVRQNGGGVVTCAGEDVQLTPRSAYNTERVINTFGSADKPGYRTFSSLLGGKVAEESNAAAKTFTRITSCDAEGDFSFENLPSGDYFLGTAVRWQVPNGFIPEGGGLFAPVSVSGGETKRVLMKP